VPETAWAEENTIRQTGGEGAEHQNETNNARPDADEQDGDGLLLAGGCFSNEDFQVCILSYAGPFLPMQCTNQHACTSAILGLQASKRAPRRDHRHVLHLLVYGLFYASVTPKSSLSSGPLAQLPKAAKDAGQTNNQQRPVDLPEQSLDEHSAWEVSN
jgi:hypothetical protein